MRNRREVRKSRSTIPAHAALQQQHAEEEVPAVGKMTSTVSGETSTTIPEEADEQPQERAPLQAFATARDRPPTPAIQNGAVATSTAARPLGTHCSA